MKTERIKMLRDCMDEIKKIQGCYIGASPAWILLQQARGHISSIYHLEAETNFDEKTLGVIND